MKEEKVDTKAMLKDILTSASDSNLREDDDDEQTTAKVGADGQIHVMSGHQDSLSPIMKLMKQRSIPSSFIENSGMDTTLMRKSPPRRRRTPSPTIPDGTAEAAALASEAHRAAADVSYAQAETEVDNAVLSFEASGTELETGLSNIESLREKIKESMTTTAEKEGELQEAIGEQAITVDEGFVEEGENLKTRPTSVLGGEINGAKRDLRNANDENIGAIVDQEESGMDEYWSSQSDGERGLEDVEDAATSDLKGENGDMEDDLDSLRDTDQEAIRDLKMQDRSTGLEKSKNLDRDYSNNVKQEERSINDAMKSVATKVNSAAQKEFSVAEKTAAAVFSTSNKALGVKESKSFEKFIKLIGKFSDKSMKQFQTIERGSVKLAAGVTKDIERQVSSDAIQHRDLVNTIEQTKEIMGEIVNEGKIATDQVRRTSAALPEGIKAVDESFSELHKELKQQVTANIVDDEEKNKGILEQAAIDASSKLQAQLNTVSQDIDGDVEELTKRQQASSIKMRDAAGEVANEQVAQNQLQEAAGEEVAAGRDVANTANQEVTAMQKQLDNTGRSAIDALKGEVKGFRKNIKDTMTQTENNIQGYIGATGGPNSIPATVAAKLQDLTVETSSSLQSMSKEIGQLTQDIEMPMQDAQQQLSSKTAQLGAVMGVGDDVENSVYNTIVAGFPTRENALESKATRIVDGMDSDIEKLKKEGDSAQSAIGGSSGSIKKSSDQARATAAAATNQLTQSMAQSINKAAFGIVDEVDGLKRAIATTQEKQSYSNADLLATDKGINEELLELKTRNEQLYASERSQEQVAGASKPLSDIAAFDQKFKGNSAALDESLRMHQADELSQTTQAAQDQVNKQKALLLARSASDKAYVKEAVQSFVNGLENGVSGTKQAAEESAKEIESFGKRLAISQSTYEEGVKSLHNQGHGVVSAADAAITDSHKAFGQLSVEQVNAMSAVKDKLAGMMQTAGMASRRKQDDILNVFEKGTAGLKTSTDATLRKGKNRISSVEATVQDHATNNDKAAQAAQFAWQQGRVRWGKQITDAEAMVGQAVTKQRYAEEAGANSLHTLENSESASDRRMVESLGTLGSITEDFGARSADKIAMAGDDVESKAKIALVNSETTIQGLRAQERMAAEKQDQRDQELARAVGSEMGEIDNVIGAAGKGFNLTEAQMTELKELLKVEQDSLVDNEKYLKSYVGQSSASILGLLSLVAKQMMKEAHSGFTQASHAGNSIDSFNHLMSEATGGEAFKTLEKIAAADELAIKTGGENEELDYWLEMFEKESVNWRKKVDVAFEDADVLQDLTAAQAKADKSEQEANQARLGARLQGKMGAMINGMGGASVAGLETALGSDVNTLNQLGATRSAADNQMLAGLKGELQSESQRSLGDMSKANGEIDSLNRENEGAHSQLSEMEKMLLAIQKQNEARLESDKKTLNTRARQFSEAMLDDGHQQQAAPPNIVELKKQAQELQREHLDLQERHEKADQTMSRLLGKITQADQTFEG